MDLAPTILDLARTRAPVAVDGASFARSVDGDPDDPDDPVVATVSVGAPRPFRLRPRGGGRSHSFDLGRGDLLVMGGSCQHDWEHTVPKVRAAGPRISITFRHGAR